MSRANPRKAIAAMMPLPLRVGTEHGKPMLVQPMTLGMYAALEYIESPLLTGDEGKKLLEWLPTLYLMTHGPHEIFTGDLVDRALAWAEGQPVDVIWKIKDAAGRQMDSLLDVIPEIDDDEKKNDRAVTAGSPTT